MNNSAPLNNFNDFILLNQDIMNRILIVEDNNDVLWVVKIVLQRYQFKVMAIPR